MDALVLLKEAYKFPTSSLNKKCLKARLKDDFFLPKMGAPVNGLEPRPLRVESLVFNPSDHEGQTMRDTYLKCKFA